MSAYPMTSVYGHDGNPRSAATTAAPPGGGSGGADEETPLLDFMKTSRTPLCPSRTEMSLYEEMAVGVDGKGGQASTFVQAKRQTICVLNCSLIAHGVILLPQLFVYFVRWNELLKYVNVLVVLNILSLGILNFAEWWQLRAMRATETFRAQQQIAERAATGLTAALTCAAAGWICAMAARRLGDRHFLMVFSQADAALLLCLSTGIFVTAACGLVCTTVLLLPKYRALWEERDRQKGRPPSLDVFGNLYGNHVANSSTESYARNKKVQKGCVAHTKWSLGIVLVPVVLEMVQSLFNALVFVFTLASAEVPRLPTYYLATIIGINVAAAVTAVVLLVLAWKST